jgi:Phage integrase family
VTRASSMCALAADRAAIRRIAPARHKLDSTRRASNIDERVARLEADHDAQKRRWVYAAATNAGLHDPELVADRLIDPKTVVTAADADRLVSEFARPNPFMRTEPEPNVARRVLKPAARRAGVEWAAFHTLRHTCATELFKRGLNAKQVQVWLGHHSPAFTLAVYVHLLSDDLPESPFGTGPLDRRNHLSSVTSMRVDSGPAVPTLAPRLADGSSRRG